MIIVIPAYQPDEELISVVKSLSQYQILVVDDGSGSKYDEIFNKVGDCGAEVIRYAVNHGKGYALKIAFRHLLNSDLSIDWVITVDADGQHKAVDIEKVIDRAECSNQHLIIGCRQFTGYVPLRSKFGNWFARMPFRLLTGVKVSDTQSGLRAYRGSELRKLISISGDRYEYEMNCLIKYQNSLDEVPIETVYEIGNKSSHYRPIMDSFRICRIVGATIGKYCIASLSSSVLDLVLFQMLCIGLFGKTNWYVAISTILARIISAIYNYTVNFRFVFRSKKQVYSSGMRYFALAIVQMLCSAVFTTALLSMLPVPSELFVKIPVDTLLFFVSYYIQKKVVF